MVQRYGDNSTMTLSLGLITPHIDDDYFGVVLLGVLATARAQAARVLVYKGIPADLRASRLATAVVDGWLVLVASPEIREVIGAAPLVVVAGTPPDSATPVLTTDNAGGMAAAVAHLISHGHQRIGFVGGLYNAEVQQRYDGYQAALAAAGLSVDPALAFLVDINMVAGGRRAAQAWLAAGRPCTALVTATDDLAMGVMEVVQAAGVTIPADLALVSFDDVDQAQYLSPPLTTVRQRPTLLGETGAQLLLDRIAGRAVAPITLIGTTLMVRGSCGCAANADQALPALPAPHAADAWPDALATALAALLVSPLPLDAPPATVWPGVTTLIAAIQAGLDGAAPPAASALRAAWQPAIERTPSLDLLGAMLALLQQAGVAQLARADPARLAHLLAALDALRAALFYGRVAAEATQVQRLQEIAQQTSLVNLALLGLTTNAAPPETLAWLGRSHVARAVYAAWADGHQQLVVRGVYERRPTGTDVIGRAVAAAAFPPAAVLGAVTAEALLTALLPVQTEQQHWGLLLVELPMGGTLAFSNVVLWSRLMGAALDRAALVTSLQAQQQTLQRAYDRERSSA